LKKMIVTHLANSCWAYNFKLRGLLNFDLITLATQSFINDHLVDRFSLNLPSIMKCFRHFIR
jgi:hypothetical protein